MLCTRSRLRNAYATGTTDRYSKMRLRSIGRTHLHSQNRAPKEVWPSTFCFRHILCQVGKRLGRDADVYLERIPDRDFRLFAQIELAAALAGLPEFHETERTWRGDIRTDRNSMTA